MKYQTRRKFIRTTLCTSLGLSASSFVATSSTAATSTSQLKSKPLEVIDTHTHFYDPTRSQGVPWPGKDDSKLFRTVLPKHYKAITARHGVVGTVVVEASSWVEDNQWILDLASADPFIVGFVGNLKPGSEEYSKNLKRFAKNPVFRGIRIGNDSLQKGMGQSDFLRDLQELQELDLSLDVLGPPHSVPAIVQLSKQIPKLRIVIDHVANLRIDGKLPPLSWRENMKAAGDQENIYCKVSGLVEGTGLRDGTAPVNVGFYEPVLDGVYRSFGSQRLFYGSNWPVSEPYAFYSDTQGIVDTYFSGKGTAVRDAFFSKNAKRAYRYLAPRGLRSQS